MKITSFFFILLAFLFQSCQSLDETSTFWVSGIKTECAAGAGETVCLQICKTDDLANADWEIFYATIDGFEFEDGTLQKIEVMESPQEKTASDASNMNYTLVNIVETKPDTRIGMHDIWVCKAIAKIAVGDTLLAPNMEINLRKMTIMGSNTCNNFSGKIERLTSTQISLGPIAETKMMCQDMKVPDAFSVAINNVATYKIENLMLRFYDEQGSELLAFMKVD